MNTLNNSNTNFNIIKDNFYHQITFTLNLNTKYNQILEEFIDACSEAGALSVSIEDALADTIDETPVYGEPGHEIQLGWQHSTIIVLLAHDYLTKDFLIQLKTFTDIEIPAYKVEIINDTDWISLTQSQFEPIPIGEKIIIVPSWHLEQNSNNPQSINRITINLDPGLAFGTGSHATTNLCLQWLEQNINTNNHYKVLDYGCGSGILAIAASKLGAELVIGVDIDNQAVQSAIYNAQNNQVIAQFYSTDDKYWLSHSIQKFDIVVANILSNPLKVIASLLCNKVAPNGYLVLSGVLNRQSQELIETYTPYINLKVWQEQEGWICMVGKLNT